MLQDLEAFNPKYSRKLRLLRVETLATELPEVKFYCSFLHHTCCRPSELVCVCVQAVANGEMSREEYVEAEITNYMVTSRTFGLNKLKAGFWTVMAHVEFRPRSLLFLPRTPCTDPIRSTRQVRNGGQAVRLA